MKVLTIERELPKKINAVKIGEELQIHIFYNDGSEIIFRLDRTQAEFIYESIEVQE